MSLNLLNSQKSSHLTNLDWNLITLKISQYARLEKNIENFKNSDIPAKSLEAITNDYTIIDFFFKKINNNQHFIFESLLGSLPKNQNYINSLKLIKKNGVITFQNFHEIALFVETLILLFQDLDEIFPQLGASTALLKKADIDLLAKKFVKPLRVFISSEGEIDYLKHPELNAIQTAISSIEQSIRKNIQELVHSQELSSKLQYFSYDIINDHYVLPFKSDSYSSQFGQIIAHSNSGFTLYCEPVTIAEKSSKRKKLLAEREEIIYRICQDFSKILYTNYDNLNLMVESVELIDYHLAKSVYCFNMHLNRPQFSPKPVIKLTNFFHPLIEKPVKNDFELDVDQPGVILSGPNTGGKTAALKAVALTHLFLHFGLFVPADHALLYPFSGIFYVGNDQQNLASGLSSFSSEVSNYLKLFSELSETNLVIIDEIFNSTSSEEASALSLALIDELITNSNCKFFISTHHHLLKKNVQHENKYISAHVGFNLEKESPTYKIYYGTPGSSHALQIFNKLTQNSAISADLIHKARRFLDNDVFNYEKLLFELNAKETELTRILDENREINRKLIERDKNIEAISKLKMQENLHNFDEKIQKILNKSQELFEQVKQGEIESEKKLFNAIRDINTEIIHEKQTLVTPKNATDAKTVYSIPKKIKENNSYHSLKFNKAVLVKKVNLSKKIVSVTAGNISTILPIEDLRELPTKLQSSTNAKRIEVRFSPSSSDHATSVDCRGMRIEQFEQTVEQYCGYLLAGDIPFLEIIHGHGEGVLKNFLRSYLKKASNIFMIDKTDDANDGSTRILLKN